MILFTFFTNLDARRLEGGGRHHIDSQRLLHELMSDRIKQRRSSRSALENKALPTGEDRLSPAGPNHTHNNQVHR